MSNQFDLTHSDQLDEPANQMEDFDYEVGSEIGPTKRNIKRPNDFNSLNDPYRRCSPFV